MRHNENEALRLNLENTRGKQVIFWVCCTLECGHGYIMLMLWLNCIIALSFSFNLNHTAYFYCISFLILLCIFPSIQRKAIYFQLVLDVCQIKFYSQLIIVKKIFSKQSKASAKIFCFFWLFSGIMHSKVIHPPAPNKISVGHQSIPQMSVIIPLSPENPFALFSTGSLGFPGTSGGKDSTCNAGVPGSIPGLGSSSPGEGIGYPLQYSWASTVAQMVKNLLQCGRPGFDPWFGKIPWRSGNPLRYSCLENPMDGGA